MKLILCALFVLSTNILLSQINSFPYKESFEETFIIGSESEFISNWKGNIVATSNRIFSGSDPRSGLKSLNIISTSSFQAMIEIRLNLSEVSDAIILFHAFSKQNGSAASNRPALLSFSTSIDGGLSFSEGVSVGDENSFPNDNFTSYAQYGYQLPSIANGKTNIVVKMIVQRGNGIGSSAELVIDDLSIEGQKLGLIVNNVRVISPTEIEVSYNQQIEPHEAKALGNYSLDYGLIPIYASTSTDSTVNLRLNRPLVNNNYTLTVEGITDLNGNTIAENSEYSFSFQTQTLPRQIVVNEIFADPSGENQPTNPALPADNEYVELYNNSLSAINIGGFELSGGLVDNFVLLPKSYVVLTSSNETVNFEGFGDVVGVSSWNSLSNNGEQISLRDNLGNLVDSLTFNKTWYHNEYKARGGWSIEQINPNPICHNLYNWSSSESAQGGTPGQENSIFNLTPDNIAPEVSYFNLVGDSSIHIAFNEVMNLSSLELQNFDLSGDNSVDSIAILNSFGTEIYLSFTDPLERGTINTITLSNIEDCSGNRLVENLVDFYIGATPMANDLIITEIMANPEPSQGLPEAEYLEVYNSSDQILSLEGTFLTDATSSTRLPKEDILPGEYMILTPHNSANQFDPEGKVLGIRNWPSLNNQSDIVSLYNSAGTLIYSVGYSDSWYRSSVKAGGGYALEMIDLGYPCLETTNWTAAEHTQGGTPGYANSVQNANPDLIGPKMLQAVASDQSTIRVTFNEKLNTSEINIDNFSGNLNLSFITLTVLDNRTIAITTLEDLRQNTVYELTADNITDCSGNLIGINDKQLELIIPGEEEELDILINEVLFNPKSGSPRFVEIYNHSEKFIDLKGWQLHGEGNSRVLSEDNLFLEPHSFTTITNDREGLLLEFPNCRKGTIFEINSMPSLPSTAGQLAIVSSEGKTIDSFSYTEDYHSPLMDNVKGISLERIKYNAATNNPHNWFSASSTEYSATPGYQNSQSRPTLLHSEEIKVDPMVFDPQSTNRPNFTTINYSFEEYGNTLNISILDSQGRIIKDLNQNVIAGKNGFLTWDGSADQLSKARVGYYMILIEIISSNGNVRYARKKVAVGTEF